MLGNGPSELHATDPDARVMADGGHWITDYHALFTDGATFREGRWREMTSRVHRVGELAFAPGALVTVGELGAEDAFAMPRAVREGSHEVYVAVGDDVEGPLALMIRVGSARVVGFVPALLEGQPMPTPPMFPLLRLQSSHLIVAAGDLPLVGETRPSAHGVGVVDSRALVVDVRDQRELFAWFGLSASGEVAAFVLDTSGGLLREFERAQPSPSDPRRIRNSCPRIATDEASLVRRIESLVAQSLLELEPGTGPATLARAFFAQPNGNLRAWLCDRAEGVAEVYYSD